MTEDILERAKALRDDMDFVSDDCIKEHISELIAEVERLRSFRGRIARILGQSPSDCDDLLIVGLDSRIILAKRLTARIKELQDLIDKPPEEADWVADYHLLQSALDGPIIDAARKWHAAYRKAQNSNLMRAKEVERLRSQSVDQVFRAKNEEISAQAARIKELSELNDGFMGNCNNLRSRCWRLEEENKRLSEAFLENQAEIEYYISQNRHFVKLWKYTDEVNKIDIRKKIEIKAREELDRIKEGGKDEQL